MVLEEDGLIDVGAPLNDYLDGYQAPDGERALTMADLMSHRLGMEDTLALFLPDLDALTLNEALARAEPAMAWSPGGATAYSNRGAGLAAKVVEDVSGRSYRASLFEKILRRLGMTETTLREADAAEATPPRMQERLYPDRPEAADMAHGFMTRPYRGQTFWGHGGYLNSFYSDMAMIEPLELGVFISLNADVTREPALRLAELVTDRALGEPRDNAPPPGRLDLEPEALSAYEGRYTPNRRAHEGF